MIVQSIFPILNPEASFFDKTLPRLQSQSKSTKILLINSGKCIQTDHYVAVYDIKKTDFNHANTRNIALKYEAEFYLFMTQDAMPYDEFLVENLVKAFDDPDVVVAYARQIPYKNADAIEAFARTTNYSEVSRIQSKKDLPTMGIKTFFCSNSCAMYRASYFHKVNGFKKDLNTNEDMEFAARAIMDGKKVAYVAEAKVYHSHRFTCKDIWKRYRSIGRFFKENRWILEEVSRYSKAESTGFNQALFELKYLLQHSPLAVPRSIVVSIVKYIAFKSSF